MPNHSESRDAEVRRIVERLQEERSTWKEYGNHVVLFGGRMMIGPVRFCWWALLIHTILVTAVFFSEQNKKGSILVPIVGGVLFLICLLSSWKVLMCDPGILKKPPFEQALANARNVEKIMRTGARCPTEARQVNGQIQIWLYCFDCQLFQPPKSAHCAVCVCCVEGSDHHCPVIGICVTKKNMIPFYIMVVSMALYHLFLLFASFVAVVLMYIRKAEHVNIAWWSASWTLNLTLIGTLLSCTLPLILTKCDKGSLRRRLSNRSAY